MAPQALKWDDRLADACGCEGIVLRDDESDGTAQAGRDNSKRVRGKK